MTDTARRFKAIEDDFRAAIRIVREVLAHIEETGAAAALRVVMLNNVIVALTATVEETLRSLLGEYLQIVREGHADHRRLRRALQKSNVEAGINELRKAKEPGQASIAAKLAANLERCLSGWDGYYLWIEQITYNQANFRSGQLTEVAKRAGIIDPWKSICDCPALEEWTREIDIDTRIQRVIAFWNALFDERDIVVHRISQASGWGASSIEQSIELCHMVVTQFARSLRSDADRLLATAAAITAAKE